MRILQLSKFYPPDRGGVETVAFNLGEWLNKKGITCDVLCSSRDKTHLEEKVGESQVYRTSTLKEMASTSISIDYIRKLKELAKSYDLLHVHLPNPMANIALYLVKPDNKITLHWHSDIIKQQWLKKAYQPLQNWLLKRADGIIAPTPNHIFNSDDKSLLIPRHNIIPFGFDFERQGLTQPDLSLVEDIKKKVHHKKIVFSVGRLVYYKGFDVLIEAASKLDEQSVVMIAGNGPLEKELRQQIRQRGLEEKVFLLNALSDRELSAYYAACDLFCLPSVARSEMFGIVQLEAMSFGKPVVSTNIKGSGVSFVNQHEKTGLVVEPRRSDQLADAIMNILKNKEFYDTLSENCKSFYSQEFKIENIIDRYVKYFNAVVSEA